MKKLDIAKRIMKSAMILVLSLILIGCFGKKNEIKVDELSNELLLEAKKYRLNIMNYCYSDLKKWPNMPNYHQIKIPKKLEDGFTEKALKDHFDFVVNEISGVPLFEIENYNIDKDWLGDYLIILKLFNNSYNYKILVGKMEFELSKIEEVFLSGEIRSRSNGVLNAQIPSSLYEFIRIYKPKVNLTKVVFDIDT